MICRGLSVTREPPTGGMSPTKRKGRPLHTYTHVYPHIRRLLNLACPERAKRVGGAASENRTHVSSLARTHNSHYTMAAE